jgi:hypothetical protein
MNEHHALVSIKKMIKAASDLDDIEAVRDQLHTMLLVANYALPPVQRKPTKKWKTCVGNVVAVSARFVDFVVQRAFGVCWIVALR